MSFILTRFCFFFLLQYCLASHATEQQNDLVEMQPKVVQHTTAVQDRGVNLEETNTPATRPIMRGQNQNWFVKNVIVEFPIIGDFFHEDPNASTTLKRVGHSTSMLVGGSIGMMVDFISKSENDNMTAKIMKSSVNMAIGMWIVTVTYNTFTYLGYAVYQYCLFANQPTQTP